MSDRNFINVPTKPEVDDRPKPVLARLKPPQSRDEQRKILIGALKRSGFKYKSDEKTKDNADVLQTPIPRIER